MCSLDRLVSTVRTTVSTFSKELFTDREVDTAHTIPGSRLAEVVSSYRLPHDQDVPSSPPITRTLSDLLEDFHHFITPTLPHLIALLNSPSVSFPPQATNIIVIDSISAVLVNAFPTAVDAYDPRQAQGKRSETIQWAASRRWSVYGDLISRLGKLAAVQNLAIILISQTTTKVRADTGAVLYPSISIKAWDGGVHNRIVLFRDWLPNIETSVTQDLHHQGVRIAALIKAGSTSCDALGKIVSFTVEKVWRGKLRWSRANRNSMVCKSMQVILVFAK